MGMHTYIGARYVPRFMGTYDPTQIYDALDVVDNGSGTSYIARKTVPAGTPLTNTDHWFVYGASSGAIISLQNDMIQAQNDIIQTQNDITDLKHVVDRNVIFISDSYANRTNSDGKTFVDIFRAVTGLDATHVFVSNANGASIVNTNSAIQFENLLNALTVPDPNAITDIVIVGGANDVGHDASQNLTGLISFINTAKTTYPNAVISFFPCGLTFTALGMNQAYNWVLPAYRKAAKYGGYFIENSEFILKDSRLLSSDLCHPTSDGVDTIAASLLRWFYGAGVDANYYIEFPAADGLITAQTDGGTALQVSSNGARTNMIRSNGSVAVKMGNTKAIQLSIDGTTPFNLGAGQGFDLTFSDTLIAGRSDIFPLTMCQIINVSTNVQVYMAYAYWQVTLTGKTLKVRLIQPIPTADNAKYLGIWFDSATTE